MSEQTNEQIAARAISSAMLTKRNSADNIAAAVVKALADAGRLVPDNAVLVSGELWRRSVLIDRDRWERVEKAATAWVSEYDYPGDKPGDSLQRAGLKPQDVNYPR